MGQKDSYQFLLIGHEGCHNRGCEALVRTTVSILRDKFPQSSFTVASLYPEHDMPLLDIEQLDIIPGISRTPELYETGKPAEGRLTSSLRPLIYGVAKATLPYSLVTAINRRNRSSVAKSGHSRPITEGGFRQVRHLKQAMLSATAVISIGGDLFIEDYGLPTYALESLEYAQFLGCQTILWGASLWPLKTGWIQSRLKAALKQCLLLTVRDSASTEYLLSLGIKDNVARVADGAFLLPPKLSERARPVWPSPPSYVVGFNGSPLLHNYLSPQKSRQVVEAIIHFLRGLIDNQRCGVVLVPHDAYPGAPERDFLFEMMPAFNRPEWVYLPPIGLDAGETKALIGQCDFFISMRFHPSIASLSQGVPTLGLFHSPKFTGLHQEVFGHTDYLISYEDISIDMLSVKFQKLQAEQDNIRRRLAARIPELQVAALHGSEYVQRLLT